MLVADEWRRGNIDDIIDREVDRAIAEVREESSWFKLWSSLASRERAQELATTAAERVYRSEPMKKAIEALATGLGKEIGKRIELATIDTAGPATQCMQAFLGRRYGTTVARIVADGAGKEYSIDPGKGGAHVSTGQVLMEGSEGIAGTVVLVVRRQLANMASRLGQRLVGSILSRLVSVVASGVGIVLIAKDIWDFRHGVLPIVADEMKSKATKDKVREELAKSIAEQIGDGLKEIAEKTAERVVEIWLEFRRAHAKVVELAERQDDFKRFLETVKAEDMPRLDEIVGLVLAGEGEAGVLKRLADGTLHRAVTALPPAALDIAREARSLETALQWSAVAGDSLPKVVEYEVHRRAKPEAFTKASLQRLLGLQDRLAITRLASLTPAARTLAVRARDRRAQGARAGAGRHPARQPVALSHRPRQGLRPARAARRGANAGPHGRARQAQGARCHHRLQRPGGGGRHDAAGQLAARPDPDAGASASWCSTAASARWLLWEKHPVSLAATGVLALILLLLMRRLLFGTRPKIVVQQGSG